MFGQQVIPLVGKAVRNNPAILGVASAASGILRQMAIKRYNPKQRVRELQIYRETPTLLAAQNQIYRERGDGSTPTIVIGGFVPDATEAAEFQRHLLRGHGDIYYLNFARQAFSHRLFTAQLADLVEELNHRSEKPLIFAISFGCGLLAQSLSQGEICHSWLRGVVMVSPVLSTEDLIRPQGDRRGGVRMLESTVRRILSAEDKSVSNVDRQIERARRCFQGLFEAGASSRQLTGRHLSIRRRIMEVIKQTPTLGGYERFMALRDLKESGISTPIFAGPTLILLAEAEDQILAPSSPTLTLLRDGNSHSRLFPAGTVRTVRSCNPADPVPHASLIFHHQEYNLHLSAWYRKQMAPLLVAVV